MGAVGIRFVGRCEEEALERNSTNSLFLFFVFFWGGGQLISAFETVVERRHLKQMRLTFY